MSVLESEVIGEGGEVKRSDRLPVRRRANVEVTAMRETWVSGFPAGGER